MPPATASEERSQTAPQTQVADFPKQRHGVRKAQTILMEYLRGWTEYYNLADMGNKVVEVDQWLRRRLRMCIRKSWKRARTHTQPNPMWHRKAASLSVRQKCYV